MQVAPREKWCTYWRAARTLRRIPLNQRRALLDVVDLAGLGPAVFDLLNTTPTTVREWDHLMERWKSRQAPDAWDLGWEVYTWPLWEASPEETIWGHYRAARPAGRVP